MSFIHVFQTNLFILLSHPTFFLCLLIFIILSL